MLMGVVPCASPLCHTTFLLPGLAWSHITRSDLTHTVTFPFCTSLGLGTAYVSSWHGDVVSWGGVRGVPKIFDIYRLAW